jgi:hypothetical protein
MYAELAITKLASQLALVSFRSTRGPGSIRPCLVAPLAVDGLELIHHWRKGDVLVGIRDHDTHNNVPN